MKYFWNLVVILIAFVIQNAIVPYIKIYGVQPDVILIVIISFSFLEGPSFGSVNGFFGGLLQDLLAVRGFGVGMISKTLIGYSSGMLEKTVFSENHILVAPALAVATILSQLIYLWLSFILGYEAHIAFLNSTLPQAFYNAILAIPLYLILEKFWDIPAVSQGKEVTIG